MERITNKDLERLLVAINTMTGNAKEPYSKQTVASPLGVPQEKYVANAGNYHIDAAYGGVKLVQMCEGGGVRTISPGGYGTKRELYNYMQAYISGYVRKDDKPQGSLGFDAMPVRFFVYDDEANEGEGDLIECNEADFIACEYPIEYERNTVHANGVKQICLTKMPRG